MNLATIYLGGLKEAICTMIGSRDDASIRLAAVYLINGLAMDHNRDHFRQV